MTKQLSAGSRVLTIATAVLFLVSSAFPVVAGLARDTAGFSRWWGLADVVLAFVLALLAIVVAALGQGHIDAGIEATTYRAYRVLTHGILVLLVLFFLVGDRITWIHCLTGFAWRAWLLLYTLPAWIALFERTVRPADCARIA
jgi:hypothetical protein